MNRLSSNTRFARLLVRAALCLAGVVGCGSTVVSPTYDAGVGAADATVVTNDRVTPVVDVPGVAHDAPGVPRDGPVSTECGPANVGRYCEPVGHGCGSTGGPCGTVSSCNCGSDHRWSCSVSGVPDCDGGAVTPADVEPVPVCPLVGVYFASFDAMGIYFEFTADGRWRGAIERADLATSPQVAGTYAFVGPDLSLTGERSDGGGRSCAMTDVGRFTVGYSGACATLRLGLISDDCAGRGDTLGRLAFARQ
jgi:hypothetical protein